MKAKLLIAMFSISVLAIIGLNVDMGLETPEMAEQTEVMYSEETQQQIQEKQQQLQRLDAEILEKRNIEQQQQQYIATQQHALQEIQEIKEMQVQRLSTPIYAMQIPDTVVNADGSKTISESHASPMEEAVVLPEVIYDTVRIPYPVKEEARPESREPVVAATQSQEPQVIVVRIPEERSTGMDWKAIISWAIAAANGLVLLVMNVKKLRK